MHSRKFIPKRPHRKSRTGCQTCKRKKVKCDEGLPSCTYCNQRNLPCHYGQPGWDAVDRTSHSKTIQSLVVRSITPSPPPIYDIDEEHASWSIIPNPPAQALSAAGTLSLVDLELLHHWSTSTFSCTFIGSSPDLYSILQHRLPDLAWGADFLMHGILAAAALHIEQMTPDPKQLQQRSHLHRARAIHTFRQALSRVVPDTDIHDAALAMSLILIIVCSQDYLVGDDDPTVLRWLSLHQGILTVFRIKYRPGDKAMSIFPLLCRKIIDITATPSIPTVLFNMIRLIDYTDPDYEGLEMYCHVLNVLGELYASLAQNWMSDDLSLRTATFCSHLPSKFVMFAIQRRPRALVILMYYLSFLKLVSGLWWIRGIADRDMSIIAKIIEPKWYAFMEIPLRAREMTDAEEIAKLLLKMESQSSKATI